MTADHSALIMTELQRQGAIDVSQTLAGKNLIVVGTTGFLGKVWLAMLLDRYPEIGTIYTVVRARKTITSEERWWSEIAPSPVFDPLRAKHPDYERWIATKVVAIDGDVTRERLGIADSLIAELNAAKGTSKELAAIVNVAGVVDFNPPLDEALSVNAYGAKHLIALSRALGEVPIMHTSTCFVVGSRDGVTEERNTLEYPFPRADELDVSHWSAEREIEECRDLVESTRRRAEDAPRQSHLLDEAKRNLRERHEPLRGKALDDELERVKRKFVRERVIEAGAERAVFWGWPNIYTYTKSIGEQVLLESGLPLTIVRPSIVESALEFPKVGWCEGISTSTPIMYLAYQGHQNIPVGEHCYYDAIPVDTCSAGMIATLAALIAGRHEVCYQLCTSDSNPLKTRRAGELIGLGKRRYYHERGKGNPIFNELQARTEPAIVPLDEYRRWSSPMVRKRSEQLASLLERFTDTPGARFTEPVRKQAQSLAKMANNIDMVFEAFVPFITRNEFRFSAKNTRALMASLTEADREKLPWAPEDIDWRHYWLDIHHKGVEEFSIPLLEDKLRKEIKPLRRHDNLVAMLEDMCERHEHALAFQRLEGDPAQLTRVTYRDIERRSAAVAAKLAAAGVGKGDRVALAGRNHPSWGIAYFGIVRSGAAAVPIDKDFDAAQLEAVLRKSKAKLALFDEKVKAFPAELCPRWDLWETAAPIHPDAFESGEGPVAPRVEIADDDLASVLYTSGTTGDPKGVMLTHENFTALIASLAPLFPLEHQDRVLSVLPLHHTFEFTCGMLLPLSRGARVIYLDEINGDRMIEGLDVGQVTAMIGVPALWELIERRVLNEVRERGRVTEAVFEFCLDLNRNIGKTLGYDVGRVLFGPVHQQLGGNLKYLVSGAAALPKDVHRTFQGLGLHLAEGYGLTEAAPVLTLSKASPRNKGDNVGKSIPGVEIKIDSPNDEGIGEVLARGPNVMVGYEGDEAETQRVLDGGWLRTGDLGKLDRKGRLKIVGRSKEVILSASGENVYPDDVEVMLGLPKFIKELSIVGLPDRDKEGAERVAVLAVPDYANRGLDSHDQKVDKVDRRREAEFELRKDIAELPRHMRPTVIHFTDVELPRTATRKVIRKEVRSILSTLREASEAVAAAKVAPGNADGVAFVRSAIAAIARKPPEELLPGHDLQNDLGFDSLMVVELTSTLEAAAPKLGNVDLSALRTVAEIEDAVRAVNGRSSRPAGEPSRTRQIEKDEQEVSVPEFIREPAKLALTAGQLNFYRRFMQVKVTGKANIPYNRHTLVVANHASHLDMGLAKSALGSYGEKIVALAAEDYFFTNKWMRAYFENFTNMAALDRRSGLRKAIEQAGEHIKRGRTVLIFPEGTRSADGVMTEFMPLVGHLVLNYNVDVLPLWLGGTHEALPKGATIPIPRKRHVEVRIGPPLTVEQLETRVAGMKRSDAYREVARLAHDAVAALRDGRQLDLDRDEVPAATPRSRSGKHAIAGVGDKSAMTLLFEQLQDRFVPGAVTKPTSFYFSLGEAADGKWTLALSAEAATFRAGRPDSGTADCVLKTSVEIFQKIVRESYTPSVAEFMSGKVKSNDIALLQVFQKAFAL